MRIHQSGIYTPKKERDKGERRKKRNRRARKQLGQFERSRFAHHTRRELPRLLERQALDARSFSGRTFVFLSELDRCDARTADGVGFATRDGGSGAESGCGRTFTGGRGRIMLLGDVIERSGK